MNKVFRPVIVLAGLLFLVACGSTTPPSDQPEPEPTPPPTISVTATPASPKVGDDVTFTANVSAHDQPYTVAWHLGDGTDGTGDKVSHTYTTSGTYSVSAKVTAAAGTANASTTVIVTDPALEPEPDEDKPELTPYDGEADLGMWVWVAVTSNNESFGTVTFNEFEGSLTAESREIITGSWKDCTFGACVTMGPAMMGEVLVTSGWEHSFAFFNTSGDVRSLGAEIEEFEPESGDKGYIAIGEFYGVTAAFALIHSEDLSALAIPQGLTPSAADPADAQARWALSEEMKALFQEVVNEP